MSLCVFVPTAADDDDDGSGASRPDERAGSESAVLSGTPSPDGSARTSDSPVLMPATPTPSTGGLWLFRSGSNALKVRPVFSLQRFVLDRFVTHLLFVRSLAISGFFFLCGGK